MTADRQPAAGVSHKKIIPKSYFRGSKAALDRVLIDFDMTKSHLRVACQKGPAVRRVGHRLSQITDDRGIGGEHSELLMQAFQGGFGLRMAPVSALRVRQPQPCRLPFDSIQRGDVAKQGQRLEFVGLDGRQHVAPKVRNAFKANDVRPMLEDTRIHFCAVRLDLTDPLLGKKVMQDRSAARRRELDDERFLVRGQIAPQVGIVGATSALGAYEFGEGFIDLNIATRENFLLQLLADRNQQMCGAVEVTAARLAGYPKHRLVRRYPLADRGGYDQRTLQRRHA
jgi:hypothetical protein